jgi:hypothetical protein
MAINLMKPLVPLLQQGWKFYAKKRSTFNAAVSYTMKHVVKGEYPNFLVDYKKIVVSTGNLPPVLNLKIVFDAGQMRLTWANNSGEEGSKPTDLLLLALINPAKGETFCFYNEATRGTRQFELELPEWADDTFHAYVGFVSDNGGIASNSVCVNHIADGYGGREYWPLGGVRCEVAGDEVRGNGVLGGHTPVRGNDTVNGDFDTVKSKNDTVNDTVNYGLGKDLEQILTFIIQNPNAKSHQIEQFINKSRPTVCRNIKVLKDKGLIAYAGSDKTGGYVSTGGL